MRSKLLLTIILLSFLVLLQLVPLISADLQNAAGSPDHISTKLEDLEVDEDDEELELPSWEYLTAHPSKSVVNVDAFGAVGDGVSDDTQAFVNAWNKACSIPKPIMLVPKERTYLLNSITFTGPCADKMLMQIDGCIVAPGKQSWDLSTSPKWLVFRNLTGLTLKGNGVIDGNGIEWWETSCKTNKSNPCTSAPTALTIEGSTGVSVRWVTVKNAAQMNLVIARSDSVRVMDVKVLAPGDSPNTDGIHVTASTNVLLQKCNLAVGDDCVSIVSGCSNIRMKNITCGPGHGISIGSLGKDNSIGTVERVVLDTAILRGTSNGLRIKTWQGGSGYVKAVRFHNVQMLNVDNPIIIDQFYCDSPKSCQNQSSAVAISKIMYNNISGTSNTLRAMKFKCSDSVPCTNITLTNISLQRNSDGGDSHKVETYCNSVSGICQGSIQPSAQCLLNSSSDKKMSNVLRNEEEADTVGTHDPIHSEL